MNEFKRLLAAITLYAHNVHVLHWKIYGIDFDPVHEKLGEYYDLLNGHVDDVAEIGMQIGVDPPGFVGVVDFVKDDDQFSYVVLRGSDNFSSRQAFEQVNKMFEHLIQIYDQVIATDIPADIINKLQEHQFDIRKQLQYKNKQRLR